MCLAPLVRIAFAIFHSNQGSQGLLHRPSKQELENTFGTHKDTDVVTMILQKGKEEAGDSISSSRVSNRNDAKGSASVDTRGGIRLSGI